MKFNQPSTGGGGGGSGTVTSVSVVSANGFAGTVATASTTPAITLSTSINGILKGNGTSVSAVTVGSGLSFDGTTLSATGGGGTPGGSSTQLQYNNAGAFGGITGATTNGSVVTLTTPVLNGTATGTGVSQSSSASTLVQRDVNSNIYINNYFTNSTSTVSAGGTTVLTIASSRVQNLTGTLSQTFQLPDATTLQNGNIFLFNNNSSGSLIVTNNGTTTLYTAPAGGYVQANLLDNSTTNGTWDFHALPPSSVTWSSGVGGLVFNTALTTTPMIASGASSATSPAFIPQRGTTNTGYSGDATTLYGVIGGATASTLTATNLTLPSSLTLGVNATTLGQIKLFGSTSGDVTIKPAAVAGTATVFQLPSSNGTNGYVLQTDGTGVTSWVAAGAGSSAFSGLTAATGTNTIDNTNYAQTWNWSTATTEKALTIGMTGASQTTSSGLVVTQSGTTTGYTGSLVNITGSSTTGSGNALQVTGVNTTAGDTVKIVNNAITNGTSTALNISHTTSVIGAGSSLARISSTGVNTGTTTGTLLDLSSTASTSGTQFLQTYSGLTTGIGESIVTNALTTGNALKIVANAVTSGSVVDISSTSTGAASNTQKMLNIALSGANGTSTQSTYGAYISNTHTGTSSTNYGIYTTSSGGTNNYSLYSAGIAVFRSVSSDDPVLSVQNSSGSDFFAIHSRNATSGIALRTAVNSTFIAVTDSNGNISFGSSTNPPASGGKVSIQAAVTASANFGLLNIGDGKFDGSTAGKFAGSSNGTIIAANPATLTGNFIDLQVAGSSKFSINASGRILPRVSSLADATSITPTGDTADMNTHTNTQAAGTLTVNAPSGTPVDGQMLRLRIKSTNVQTYSFNAIYRGGTTVALPTASTGSSKTDYMMFIYNSADSKWDIQQSNTNY